MTYTLYGDIGSGSSTVELALAEIGAPVLLKEVPLEGDHQLKANYTAINPMGRLPTLLLPDGTLMTESAAILAWLADAHPEAALLPPPGSTGRATVLRWMLLAAAEFYPHVTRYDYPDRFGVSGDVAATVKARAQEMGGEVWQVVEQHAGLTGEPARPYLLGETFTVADIYLAVLSRWMGGRESTPRLFPKLEVLAQAVAARPKLAPVWRKHRLHMPTG